MKPSFMLTAASFFLIVLAGAVAPASAQFTYTDCDTLKASDFRVDTLVRRGTADTLTREPLKMAFSTDAQGNVDVYFVQRHGMVRKYSGATRTTSTLANFNFSSGTSLTDSNQVYASGTSSSEGLMGIALDPNFKTNGWVYLYTTIKTIWKIQRYKLTGSTLDMNSAKTIFRFTHTSFSQHMGGAMRFDNEGNFWITVSDNGSTGSSTWPSSPDLRYQAANTNSYLGKILRIRLISFPDDQNPVPGVGTTYTIPAGNLFTPGTAKTLPEIYVMGSRNPYTLALDTVRKAIAWGDVGPDDFTSSSPAPQQTEEFNFTTKPGFFGWPFWAGNYKDAAAGDTIGGIRPTSSVIPTGSTREAPINDRTDNTGLVNLPSARPSMIAYGKACAVTGPIYYYSPGLNSTVKFPPHFHGTWFVGDFNTNWIDAVSLNAAGNSVLARKKIFSGATASGYVARVPIIPTSNGLLEMDMGPDGALYVMNYAGYRTATASSGIVRIAYTGSCRPTSVPVTFGANLRAPTIRLTGATVSISHGGLHRAEIRDLSGRLVWSRQGRGPASYDLNEAPGSGLRILTVTAPGETFSRKLFR